MASPQFALLAAHLLLVFSIVESAPEEVCVDTGPRCLNQCSTGVYGNYQWCGSCRGYIACNYGVTSYMDCPASLVWDDISGTCASASRTCRECIVYPPSTTPATGFSSTTASSVDWLCASTGPKCYSDCYHTNDGTYQWCGRCDYYLSCSGGITIKRDCYPNSLVYDDIIKACDYTSQTCQDDPCYTPLDGGNACLSNPCVNNGTCVQAGNGYECHCKQGYGGTHCENVDGIDECASVPCLNGAICYDNGNTYQCGCSAGWTGTNCQTNINECLSAACLNNATCSDQINGFTCTCVAGYTGSHCQINIKECLSSPCVNGGTCVDQINSYRCMCVDGFTGTTCSTGIDECASAPCMNGGVCTDQINGYTCTCTTGWTGAQCQTNINECLNQPCKNGATCIDQSPGFTCNCAPGFTGTTCLETIDECASNPCKNGATCQDYVAYYTCICPPGFTGTTCQSVAAPFCGRVLHEANVSTTKLDDYSVMCYITTEDAAYTDSACSDLLVDLPQYGDATQLVKMGGDYGCWLTSSLNDPQLTHACTPNLGHTATLSECTDCTTLAVCIHYPK